MLKFTYVQSLLLALIPKITGTLSMIGSFSIAYEVIRDKTKLSRSVYHRLMMIMSIWDINVSFWLFMSTWPMIPSESTNNNVLWSVGNTATCSTQGFCIQLFGAMAVCYNAMLGLYYLLQIKYSWRCETFRMRIKLKLKLCGTGGGGMFRMFRMCITTEQLLHIIPCLWGISTAISGLVLKLYNNATLWCWIASYPTYCNAKDNNIDCTRGENAWMFQWIFWYGPLWIAIFFSLGCMVMMYLSVRETERNVNKWRPSNEYGRGANNNNNNNDNDNNGKYNGQQQNTTTTTTTTTISTFTKSTTTATGIEGTKEFNEVVPSLAAAVGSGGDSNNNNADGIEEHKQHEEGQKRDEIGSSIKKRYGRMKTIKNNRMKTIKDKYNRNMQRSKTSRRVFYQAMFYMLSFYLAWTPATVNRLTQALNGKTYYGLALLHVITAPLQGLFNYCVYLRPRILEYNQKYRTRRNSSRSDNDTTPSLLQIIKWAIGKSYGREPPPPPPRIQRQLRPRIQQQQQQQNNNNNNHSSGSTNNNDTNNDNDTGPDVVVVATDDILPNQETKKEKTSWLGIVKKWSKTKINEDDSESDASSITSANGAYMPSTQFEIDEHDEEEKSYPANNNNNGEKIPNNSKEEK